MVIKSGYAWVIKVFGKTVPPKSECFGNFPGPLSLDILENFDIMLQALKLCKANDDFTDILAKRIDINEPFPGAESERIALAESSNGHGQLIKENFDIVRQVNFEYIVKGKGRCQHSSSLRHNSFSVRASLDADRQKRTQESSATNLRYLTNHELVILLEKTQKAKWQVLKQVARLLATISRIMREEGVCVSSEHNEIFRSVLNKEDPKLEEGRQRGCYGSSK